MPHTGKFPYLLRTYLLLSGITFYSYQSIGVSVHVGAVFNMLFKYILPLKATHITYDCFHTVMYFIVFTNHVL